MNQNTTKIEKEALRRFSYGLFLLTAAENGRDNGCIVDAVQQVTTAPARFTVSLRKTTYTHGMIRRTGLLNISILDTDAPYSLFRHFGFQSGRKADKFADFSGAGRAGNGLTFLKEYACAFLCGRVVSTLDLGTHTLFLSEITETGILSDLPPMTYAYYQSKVKSNAASTPHIEIESR